MFDELIFNRFDTPLIIGTHQQMIIILRYAEQKTQNVHTIQTEKKERKKRNKRNTKLRLWCGNEEDVSHPSFLFSSVVVDSAVDFTFSFSFLSFSSFMFWLSLHSKGCHKVESIVTPASFYFVSHKSSFPIVILGTGDHNFPAHETTTHTLQYSKFFRAKREGNGKRKFVFGFGAIDILTATTRIITFKCE